MPDHNNMHATCMQHACKIIISSIKILRIFPHCTLRARLYSTPKDPCMVILSWSIIAGTCSWSGNSERSYVLWREDQHYWGTRVKVFLHMPLPFLLYSLSPPSGSCCAPYCSPQSLKQTHLGGWQRCGLLIKIDPSWSPTFPLFPPTHHFLLIS